MILVVREVHVKQALVCLKWMNESAASRMLHCIVGNSNSGNKLLGHFVECWGSSGMSHTTTASAKPSFRMCCGRQRKCWMDNIKKWTSQPMPELFTMASCRKKKKRKRISAESSFMSPQTTQSVKGLNRTTRCTVSLLS